MQIGIAESQQRTPSLHILSVDVRQRMLDSLPAAVYATDRVGPDGTILWANEAELAMLGYRRDEYIGHHIAEFHVDAPVIDDMLGRLCSGEKLRDYETRMRCKDGSIRTILVDSTGLWEEGRFVHTQCFSRDVTEQRRSEAATAGLAAIVDSSEDAILATTLDGIITAWNRSAERIYGYTAAEAIGQSLALIVPHDKEEESQAVLARLREGQSMGSFETERAHRDGHRVPVSVTASPIRDKSGRVVGASKIARDITERLRVESALRDADRRKDEFLASLAHELRNPLAPIRTGLQILGMSAGNPRVASQTIGMMERQLGQLVRLIDDLLDISRISTGKITLRKERVAIQAILQNAVDSVRPYARERRQEVMLTIPGDPIALEADPVRLTQVFSNLLNNALKFSPEGATVRMTAMRKSDVCEIAVQDDGVGIPTDLLSRVFEPFVQLRANAAENTGLGVGLTLVKRFVELHGGTVEALSDGLGRGSTFVVRLAIAHGASPECGKAAITQHAPDAKPSRVLVVDDNRDAAISIGELLKLAGHEVHIAHDGPQALRLAAGIVPDVVLLDLGLPGMSGYEVCAQLKQQAAQKPYVVALTGWGQDTDRRRTAESGFDYHLVKPTELAELMSIFENSERGAG